MSVVNSLNGIVYGFRLMVYLVGVYILAGGFSALTIMAASTMTNGNPKPGLVLGGVVGVTVVVAGLLGLSYKVIADAVYTGVDEAIND